MTQYRNEPDTAGDRAFRPMFGLGADMLTERLGKAGQVWLEASVAINRDAMSFVQERVLDDMNTARAMMECRDAAQWLETQSAWTTRMLESWSGHWLGMMDQGWRQLEQLVPPNTPASTPADPQDRRHVEPHPTPQPKPRAA